MNQELLQYISQQVVDGFSRDQIRQTLVDAGWPEADIGEAFDEFERSLSASPSKPDQEAEPLAATAPASQPAAVQPSAAAEPATETQPAPATQPPASNPQPQGQPMMVERRAAAPKGHWFKITLIAALIVVLAAIALGVGIVAAHFYLANFVK
ncbi:MAG: hypothetical protein ACREHG_08785 [Candidatus Saccharimonadales bacterium]